MLLSVVISYRFDSTKITIILYTNYQIYFISSFKILCRCIGCIGSIGGRFENLQTGLLINNRLSAPNNPI